MTDCRVYKLKALTDIWTGDAERNGNRLITTGLLGSIRWWYEVLIRGLGGQACDPSATKCNGENHCVACELFGCTGWARKFRFDVENQKSAIRQTQIEKNTLVGLRFTPLRPVSEEEWSLLSLTLRIAAHYGAIGGKTTNKPACSNAQANFCHHDYGLVELQESIPISRSIDFQIKGYINQSRWQNVNESGFAWASLKNAWFVKEKFLSVDQFNQVLKQTSNTWLTGSRGVSKKVFSFKTPARTFGFVDNKALSFDDMKGWLTQAWRDDNGWNFITGEQLENQLLPHREQTI